MITPKSIYEYCHFNNNYKPWSKYEPVIAKDPYYAYYYAKNILQKRFLLAEKIIKNQSTYYAEDTLYERYFNCKL
jgi:hypothetical protein